MLDLGVHGDDTGGEFSERRFSQLLLNRRLFDVEARVTAIEVELKKFPNAVKTELDARDKRERESSRYGRDQALKWGTLLAVVGGSIAAWLHH